MSSAIIWRSERSADERRLPRLRPGDRADLRRPGPGGVRRVDQRGGAEALVLWGVAPRDDDRRGRPPGGWPPADRAARSEARRGPRRHRRVHGGGPAAPARLYLDLGRRGLRAAADRARVHRAGGGDHGADDELRHLERGARGLPPRGLGVLLRQPGPSPIEASPMSLATRTGLSFRDPDEEEEQWRSTRLEPGR